MIGLVATLAPTIGPTVGGYISHAFSWHWLFLVNVVPGILVATAAWSLIDFDKPNLGLFNKFDWWGLAGMAAFLGSLEYVLEEGPNNDWLQDQARVHLRHRHDRRRGDRFFWRVFTAEEPIVDLRAFSNINFAFGSLFSFVIGIGLYGLTYLYPVFLGRIRGYDSLMIGEAMFVSGLAMFVTAPISGILSSKMDLRLMMMIGFFGFAAGTWWMTHLTADWDFYELLIPQILRGCSMMLCMVPINNIALGTLPPDRLKNASGLFNLTRNLGGAVGLAADQHRADRPQCLPLCKAGRACAVGQCRRADQAAEHDAELRAGHGSRCHQCRDLQAVGHGPAAGGAAVLHGRVLHADGAVRDAWPVHHADQQAGCARSAAVAAGTKAIPGKV